MKERENLNLKIDKGGKSIKASARSHACRRNYNFQRMWFIDLNCSFERDRFIEVSDNKLSNNNQSDNNLGRASLRKSEIRFLNPMTMISDFVFLYHTDQSKISSIAVRQRNQRIYPGSGFFGSFDAPWSERS